MGKEYKGPDCIKGSSGYCAGCGHGIINRLIGEVLEEMGLEKPLTIDSQYDVDKQVSDVETLVNDEYDAIMVSPIDQNALVDVITAANEAGIVTSCAAPVSYTHLLWRSW